MKSTVIKIPVLRSDYRIFVLAARLVRKECGAKAPSTVALIQFQFAHRTPGGIAKDYLDCIRDFSARRRVRLVIARKSRPAPRTGTGTGRNGMLHSVETAGIADHN